MENSGAGFVAFDGQTSYGNERVTGGPILHKSFEFTLRTVQFSKRPRDGGWQDPSRRPFRSGTSIGANVHEARNAGNWDDPIHKMKVSAMEASGTRFWPKLCKYSEESPHAEGSLEDLHDIRNILASIIISARRNKDK